MSEWSAFAEYHTKRAQLLVEVAMKEYQSARVRAQEESLIGMGMGFGMAGSGEGGGGEALAARQRQMDEKFFVNGVQPMIVLTTHFYQEGRGLEAWAGVGLLTRMLGALRYVLGLPTRVPFSNGIY